MKKTILSVLFLAAFLFYSRAQYNAIFSFDSLNGSIPVGGLISDSTFLYGMTFWGGTDNAGTVFKIMPDGTGFGKLHDFDGGANGNIPQGSLYSDGTFLYGMTSQGGSSGCPTNGCGTIFKIKHDGTGFARIFNFSNATTGYFPVGTLISDGTFLYGLANAGGTNDWGTVFKVMPDGTGFVKLHNFDVASSGGSPNGALLFDGTFLYGMTGYGGTAAACTNPYGCGTIFKIMPDGTGFVKLLDFEGTTTGSIPDGSLIYDGTFLYGTTSEGGTNNFGVIFKIKPDGTGFAKLHDFTGTDGNYPKGTLLLEGGFLYGVANTGGSDTACSGCGVLYKIKPDGTGFMNMHNFITPTGNFPAGSLFSDGTFIYGLAAAGGLNDKGAIFKYDGSGTGINEQQPIGATRSGFTLYPNPANGKFTIETTQRTKGQVAVLNAMGEKVYQTTISEQQSSINLEMPGGIYFVHLSTDRGIASRKMVVTP